MLLLLRLGASVAAKMACLDTFGSDIAELPTPKGVVNLANHLLAEFSIPTRLEDVSDISASLFVVLYESLFSERLSGIVRQPFTKEDEIHNCQTVIDVLSSDVVHDNLSHIRGADIIAGNITSISNLLDIFQYLFEYVVNKIEGDADHNITGISAVSELSSLVKDKDHEQNMKKKSKELSDTTKKSTEILNRTITDKKSTTFDGPQSAGLNKNENRKTFDEHPVISHEEYFAMTHKAAPSYRLIRPPSPIKADQSQSLLGQKTVDSEFDESVRIDESYNDFKQASISPQIDNFLLKDYHAGTIPIQSSHSDKEPCAASVTLNKLESRNNPVSYVGDFQYSSDNLENHFTDRSTSKNQLTHSYEDLHKMVEKTTAMTRIALMTSPMRAKDSQYMKGKLPNSSEPDDTCTVKKDESKRVAFACNKSDVTSKNQLSEYGSKRPHIDFHTERSSNKRHSKTSVFQKSKMSSAKSPNILWAKSVATNKNFGATHKALLKEDKAYKEKQDILRKFYEKDHQELVEEVDEMLAEDGQKAHAKEDELVRQYLENLPKKKSAVRKGPSLITSCKQRKLKSKDEKQQNISQRQDTAEPNLKVVGDEDLLPALLEEFPYLHLSEHTWHELWRQGLHQIEALTRSYQENLRKKTQAQSQLQDAAERHHLLGDLMRKQLEHTKRVYDIRDQKVQQIKLKNKLHEKRIQSARARRYYNEYQVRARSKQLKKRTKEEMVFRELFKTALNIQKERLKDIRQYASDCQKRQETQRQNEIESLENFYQDQFKMLAERLAKEKLDTGVREIAQQQMLERMKRELRKKMESEIKQYQEQMFNDDDTVHFRQKDVDRVKQHLHSAQYTAKV
ncbi:hypothetical protein Btru_015833 [Bulinus truncatus]|nr:hypothetical protein Btru_015833 [Bulinus truncatus]